MNYLFSYGTLQDRGVQIETFGRILTGEKDLLTGFKVNKIQITDVEVLRKSNQKFHLILEYSGKEEDSIEGTLFELSDEEIKQADNYEVEDYKRITVILKSCKEGFVYVRK